jgi:type I restriction enzyme S subunit
MGWPTKPMCQVAPESPSNIKTKGRVWVLNLDMIESNSGNIINKVFEDSGDLNSVAAFDEGNVLFSKLRPYLNKVTIPDGKGYATTELVPLRPNTEELRQYFLSFLLRTDEFVKYADGIATGTKMPRMPMTALREFKCILPPTEQQDKFCGISKRADKSKYLN